jgi:Rho-related BTB domain-containing protein 1/2
MKTTQLGLEDLCLVNGLFSDILFKLEDGTCAAHKAVLMARCDMMCAMFSHEQFFKEATARVIHFPGVKRVTFYELLYFLYTDNSPRVTTSTCVDLIEIANRLCLARLVSLVEATIIEGLNEAIETGNDISEEVLRILQPCQVS